MKMMMMILLTSPVGSLSRLALLSFPLYPYTQSSTGVTLGPSSFSGCPYSSFKRIFLCVIFREEPNLIFEGDVDPMRPSIRPDPQSLMIDPYWRVSSITVFPSLYILEQGP